jgi:hypothetical protein
MSRTSAGWGYLESAVEMEQEIDGTSGDRVWRRGIREQRMNRLDTEHWDLSPQRWFVNEPSHAL